MGVSHPRRQAHSSTGGAHGLGSFIEQRVAVLLRVQVPRGPRSVLHEPRKQHPLLLHRLSLGLLTVGTTRQRRTPRPLRELAAAICRGLHHHRGIALGGNHADLVLDFVLRLDRSIHNCILRPGRFRVLHIYQIPAVKRGRLQEAAVDRHDGSHRQHFPAVGIRLDPRRQPRKLRVAAQVRRGILPEAGGVRRPAPLRQGRQHVLRRQEGARPPAIA
mmetsp:Transcript_7994/g.29897  ORF Transcript_7994/g.29897 Transcript_7994/m.29897 type:complete len:217 (+) Transcript_7994:996-1646(+)|eukprot:scaffold4168_cov212-Pinguiococcus_pyrenoidosus.AAC.1